MGILTAELHGLDVQISPNWHNGTGNVTCSPELKVWPRTEAEIQQVVRFARERGVGVRPVGGGWSWMPLVTTAGIMLDFRYMNQIGQVDKSRSDSWRVRVSPGVRVYQLHDALHDQGAALIQAGAWGGQTFIGAMSTGTHGTGQGLGNIESYVRGVRFIDGNGDVVDLNESDVAELRAARLSLGLLGVITEVEVEVVPTYDLAMTVGFYPYEQVSAEIHERLGDFRHLACLWAPHDESFEAVQFPAPPGLADHIFVQRFFEPKDGEAARPAGKILSFSPPTVSDADEYIELEYGVPAERGAEAMDATRDLFRSEFPSFVGPMYNRFIKGDDAYLSPFFERDSMTVSVSSSPRKEFRPVFEATHRMLVERFDARPHWGKINFFGREDLRRALPEYDRFVELRRRFDPDGLFLNDYARATFA
jgi:FAD/FMN-containing dehydrogenase